jgi:hypothetical protein
LTCINTTICKGQGTLTIFFSVFVHTIVSRSIGPSFCSFAMLFVLKPLSNIGGSICMFVCSMTMSFVIEP